MGYVADKNRYDTMEYRRCGESGLKLPAISLGIWLSIVVAELFAIAISIYFFVKLKKRYKY